MRLATALDGAMLCLQGPPGAGKTTTAARMIKTLIDSGLRVGITSNSHKAILNLMRECHKDASSLQSVKVGGSKTDSIFTTFAGAHHVTSAKDALKTIARWRLIGGTAWTFARDDMVGMIDTLFVDEAGQVSLANLVAMSRSARNIVLLGDQRQLSQPLQGTHPGESGLSCLEYFLGEHVTIPADLGVFLDRTYRLHPSLCRFISESFYEGRLEADTVTHKRVVRVPHGGGGNINVDAGLVFVPVEHEGNTQSSDEEVAVIAELVNELLGRERTDEHGAICGQVTLNDVLIVAPYNMQVRNLKAALPTGARVGTVDKFQGQQASIVIVSMCGSDANASPRGMTFLFDPNRLNVALSRARSLAIVVGNPKLANAQCTTIEQMKLANVFCAVVAMGRGD